MPFRRARDIDSGTITAEVPPPHGHPLGSISGPPTGRLEVVSHHWSFCLIGLLVSQSEFIASHGLMTSLKHFRKGHQPYPCVFDDLETTAKISVLFWGSTFVVPRSSFLPSVASGSLRRYEPTLPQAHDRPHCVHAGATSCGRSVRG